MLTLCKSANILQMAKECECIQPSLREFNTANLKCPNNIGRELYFAFFAVKAKILNTTIENLHPHEEEAGQEEYCKVTAVENQEGDLRLGCLTCYFAGIQVL